MAAETAATRWPRIVQDMVDAVAQAMQDGSIAPEKRKEGDNIVQGLKQLKDDITQDAPLR